jgi:manganese transport protein
MNRLLQSVGPAIIVAAVVIGPGSILTSSKVGATFGLVGLPVVIIAAVLMTAMVALAARLGVIYERSPCEELAARLGRPVAVLIGLTLFILVALFQSSNNIALIGGIDPMLGDQALSFAWKAGILGTFNLLIILSVYMLRNLYRSIENVMKLLIGLMSIAFFVNLVMAFIKPRTFEPIAPTESPDLLPLLGMIGTTFSVGGAFYQAYLVKEKGWTIKEAKKGVIDSVVSISLLGLITSIILLTAWRVFYGNPNPVTLSSVGDVAVQLEPMFGVTAKFIFCGGILAGALSSFLVNALIGGTVMSDSIGKGAKLSDGWPLHLTALALLIGGGVAIASLANADSTVHLITLAQALTVLGIPALALALIYLGTRSELTGDRKVPRVILAIAIIGFCVSCVLAYLTADKVRRKLSSTSSQTTYLPEQDVHAVSVA